MGFGHYKLNHFAANWDPTPATNYPQGQLIGPTRIQEDVTLAPDGESFNGTFSIDAYDEAGDLQVHLEGQITGTRIHVDTPGSSIF